MLRKQDALLEVTYNIYTSHVPSIYKLKCFQASTAASRKEDFKQTAWEIWEFKNAQSLLETFKTLF